MAGTIPLPRSQDRLFFNTNLRKQTRKNWSGRLDTQKLLTVVESDIRKFIDGGLAFEGKGSNALAYAVSESISRATPLHNYVVYRHAGENRIGNTTSHSDLPTIHNARVEQLSKELRTFMSDKQSTLLIQLVAVSIYATFFGDGGVLLAKESLAITTSGVAVYALGNGVPLDLE